MKIFTKEKNGNRTIIRILGIKISVKSNNGFVYLGPDQWTGEANKVYVNGHKELISLNREETIQKYPAYFKRISPVLDFANGIVLELGCASGNITKFMNEEDSIDKIYAVDLYQMPIEMLKEQNLSKVVPICSNVVNINFGNIKNFEGYFDTIVLLELIEHISLEDELLTLEKINEYIKPLVIEDNIIKSGTKFVISTPIGFMPDPHHCRSFSECELITHIKKHYGIIDSISYNNVQQTVCGYFNKKIKTNLKKEIK